MHVIVRGNNRQGIFRSEGDRLYCHQRLIAVTRKYQTRAAGLKENLQTKLWDPKRSFFYHMYKQDEERDGSKVRALSLTHQTGQFAGSELSSTSPLPHHSPSSGRRAVGEVTAPTPGVRDLGDRHAVRPHVGVMEIPRVISHWKLPQVKRHGSSLQSPLLVGGASYFPRNNS